MTRIDLTFDCRDADALAEFWKEALGYEDEPPPVPFATRAEWVASFDEPAEPWDAGAWIRDPAGVGPRVSFLGVPEDKVAKNRVHLDLRVSADVAPEDRWAAITAKADQLERLGATRHATHDGHHIVMQDPEGNEFCVA